MIESKLKPTIATVDSCFDLVRSHQYGIASYEVFSWSTDIHILTKMVTTSVETQIQTNVTCKTRDMGQLEKSRISCHCSIFCIIMFFSLSLFTVLRHVSLGRPLVPLPLGPHVCAILGFLSDCILKT